MTLKKNYKKIRSDTKMKNNSEQLNNKRKNSSDL